MVSSSDRLAAMTLRKLERIATAAFVSAAILGVWSCSPPEPVDLDAGRWIDLTHPFNADSIYWPTADPFEKSTVFEGHTEGGFYYSAYNFSAAEHGGTHLDAPALFAEGRQTSEAVPLDRLIGPAVVIDVGDAAGDDRDYRITAADVEGWESVHGRIEPDSIVLFDTGSGRLYSDRVAYLGTDQTGPDAVAELHFPGIHPEAAALLVERGVASVGIDTPSIDYGQSTDFRSHVILYEENIPGFENVANLNQLPPRGALVVALPMKIEGGSGGPLRIVARLPDGP